MSRSTLEWICAWTVFIEASGTALRRALNLGCINAKHPDLYGHYREAKFTQTKHHWWWKANRVFDQLSITRNHTGMVLFLEEDHYVAEDFLHVLRLMERTCKHSCERCNVLSLGTYLKTYNYFADFGRKVRNRGPIERLGARTRGLIETRAPPLLAPTS